MLKIRLQRVGRRHQPSYRLVVAEKRSKLGGPPVEDLGSYNPFSKKAEFKKERVEYWLKIGAQPTPTTHNLLVKEKIINQPKMKIKIKKRAETENKATVAEATAVPTAESANAGRTSGNAQSESVAAS